MFGQAVKAALTAVGKNNHEPLLASIYVAPGRILSTDRYRLVRSKYSMSAMADDKQDFEPFMIPAQQAKKLVDLGTLYNIEKDVDGWITLTTMDAKHKMVKRIVEPLEGDYPKVEKIMDSWESAESADEQGPGTIAFNPDLLSAWPRRHLSRGNDSKGEVMRLTFSKGSADGSSKGIKFEFGDHFEAILMPVRYNNG